MVGKAYLLISTIKPVGLFLLTWVLRSILADVGNDAGCHSGNYIAIYSKLQTPPAGPHPVDALLDKGCSLIGNGSRNTV